MTRSDELLGVRTLAGNAWASGKEFEGSYLLDCIERVGREGESYMTWVVQANGEERFAIPYGAVLPSLQRPQADRS
jgi:hypothetical protein